MNEHEELRQKNLNLETKLKEKESIATIAE